VPVINPGLAAYKACETLIDLKLAHSKAAWPAPERRPDGLFAPIPALFA